ncbi:MAG: DUF1109 family protein [Labilithrix sp.]|nr:DUF1109 family protein [Labilithrix sp.]MBX3219901.1 DUF1109 family protein [Labilithrix sp.]
MNQVGQGGAGRDGSPVGARGARGVGMLARIGATPSRAIVQKATATLVVVSLSMALLVFDLAGGLEHGSGRPLAVTVRLAGGWTTAAIALTWLTLAPRRARPSPALLAASATAAPLGLFAWMQRFHESYFVPLEGAAYGCVALTLGLALLPFVGFFALHRGVGSGRAGPLGAAAGAACGAWAGVVVELWCPVTSAVHALVGHAAPVALLVVAGTLAGARLLAAPAS